MGKINLNQIDTFNDDCCLVCGGTEFDWVERLQCYCECIECGTMLGQTQKKEIHKMKPKVKKFKKEEE